MKIAFIGKMMSGKTTSAIHLSKNHGFTRLAFADPIKVASAVMLNTFSMFVSDVVDKRILPIWDYDRIQEYKTDPAVRKLLQLVGTELGRQLIGYENLWVDMLMKEVEYLESSGTRDIVIDDCRFPNEAEALRESGFTLIRVTRPDDEREALVREKYPDTFEEILSHPSETSLDVFPSYNIYAKDVESLLKQVELFVN